MDVDWSIRPLTFLLNVLGINLERRPSNLCAFSKRQIFIYIYEKLCLAATLTIQFSIIMCAYFNWDDLTAAYSGQQPSVTSSWNLAIDYGNVIFHVIGAHICLLLFVVPSWSKLQEFFNTNGLSLDRCNLLKYRRLTWFGLLYHAIAVSYCFTLWFYLVNDLFFG